jgi:hypothetical protein
LEKAFASSTIPDFNATLNSRIDNISNAVIKNASYEIEPGNERGV